MYSELLITKTEAISHAVKMSKEERNGLHASIVWNAATGKYYVLGAGDTTGSSNEVIIGSYQNGKYIN